MRPLWGSSLKNVSEFHSDAQYMWEGTSCSSDLLVGARKPIVRFIRFVSGCKEPHIHELVFMFCSSFISLFSSSFYFELHYSEGPWVLFLYMRSVIWWTLKILHCIIGQGYNIMNYSSFIRTLQKQSTCTVFTYTSSKHLVDYVLFLWLVWSSRLDLEHELE